MDFKYKNVKKLDFKRWLLGGNSMIYAIILLVTIAAIIVVLGTTGNNEGDSQQESTNAVAAETQSDELSSTEEITQYIYPHEQYKITVNKASNFITVYSMDTKRNYTVYKQFRCSVNPSVTTQSTTVAHKYPWVVFGRNLCGRYVTKLSSGTYIHSTPYYNQNVYMVNKGAYNNLGNSATLGYIYLSVADSKWIFENCGTNTVVEVYDNSSESSPFAGVKLEPATMPYDPTDTEAANNYVPETKAPETESPETKAPETTKAQASASDNSSGGVKEEPSETVSDDALKKESAN